MSGAGPPPHAESDVAQLETLLRQSLEPATVHAAERRLNKALKSAAAVLPLAERAAASDAPAVRQLAAVLLRRCVVQHYEQLGAPERAALKALLLRQVVAEAHGAPRRSLAAAVSALGSALLPSAEGWAELLAFLSQAAQAAAPEHREVAMLVLAELFDSPSCAAVFRPHLAATAAVLRAALADPHAPQVRTAGLRAVGALATSLVDYDDAASAAALKALFPAALEVARACVAAAAAGADGARAAGLREDELRGTLSAAFEMAGEVVENGPGGLVRANLPAICALCLQLGHATAAEAEVRAHGFHCITSLLATRPKLLAKQAELLSATLALGIAATGEAGDDDDDADADEEDGDSEGESVRSLGCALLDTFGRRVPHAAALPLLDGALQQLTAAGDERSWRSACTMLAMVVEGVSECLGGKKGAARLGGYAQLLCAGCAHASPHVRAAAALGLGEMAMHVAPHALVPTHAPAIIAQLSALIDGASVRSGSSRLECRCVDKAAYALDALCEAAAQDDELIDVLGPHAPELLRRLATICASGAASAGARTAAVSAVSALVACGPRLVSAEQLEGLIGGMANLITQPDAATPAGSGLRARATECVGICALALGAERFRPLLPAACAAAVHGLAPAGQGADGGAEPDGRQSELCEHAYGFAAHMAALYGSSLDPAFVHGLLPHMLSSCKANDIVESKRPGSGEGGGDGGADSDDDGEGGGLQFGLHSGMVDEKAAAVHAIGRFCKHCPQLLGAASALACVAALCGEAAGADDDDDDEDDSAPVDHFAEGLRTAALANAPHACAAALQTAAASGDAGAIAAADRAVRAVAVHKLVGALDDEDADVVAAAAAALARLGRLAGGSVFANLDGSGGSAALESVTRSLQMLLTHSAPCQGGLGGGILGGALGGAGAAAGAGAGESDDDGSDGDRPTDDAVWEAVAALVGGLARTLGDGWAPAFDALLPLLVQHAGAGLPLGEQAAAIGVVAEGLERLGPAHAQRLAPQLLPLALRLAATPLPARAAADEDEDDGTAQLVQNAAYCAGVLAAPGGDGVAPHLQQLLGALRPLLQRGQGVQDRLVDNALGAVARTLRGSFGVLPLEQIVPVMLAALPIREDFRENGVTLRTLVTLFSSAQTAPALSPHLPAFVALLREAVGAHDAEVAAKAASAQMVRDDDEADDQDEQETPLTPELRAELVAYVAACGGA